MTDLRESVARARVVVWFSCGAASAVAAKLTLADYDRERVRIIYVDPGSEHPDSQRFKADCQRWFNHPIETIRSEKYRDTWQVWEERKFLVGPTGALCTGELKKAPRFAFQRPDDVQVFGYTAEERDRAEQFCKQNFEVCLVTPLIARGLMKADCLAMIERAGIELPAMYRLGFSNNNCIGCVKGGMGYWNRIRRTFPEVFDRMAALERRIGYSVNKDDAGPVWLDELDPNRGRDDEIAPECSLLCAAAEKDMAA